YVVGAHPRARLIATSAPAQLRRGTAAPFSVRLVDGVVAGLWDRRRRGRTLTVRVDAFGPLDATRRRALEREVERIGAFLGLEASLLFGQVEPRHHL
ncbi:MAG: winged helix DNA-binding domain-containing protein, partial [Chloroflexi bacterium]|nr:winged helix DNA-binding domain-containing protein [Chloroflexota bacterium]